MIPAVGQKFGPFEILGRLGGGGMGLVFRAWDSRLHREVAMKLLQADYAMPGMRERFLREARAASALNHPNICTIFDIGEREGDPYLVMELLHGETLKDRIINRPIPADELICIAKDCAEALGAAHFKGIVHRDIKPANIFLVDRPRGFSQTKVLDFGLAKVAPRRGTRASRTVDITTEGATVGTLAYMSPEQARGEPLDSRSDLFSLGVVMYEMATRQIPFPGATSALVFVKLLNGTPEPVRDWNGSIPKDLEKIIQRLLAKDPAARFQTARELHDALERIAEKSPGGGWLRKAITGGPAQSKSQDWSAGQSGLREVEPRRERRFRDPVDFGYTGEERRGVSASQQSVAPREAIPPRHVDLPGPAPESTSQMLRPVARVPRQNGISKLQAQGKAASESRSVTPMPIAPDGKDPSRSSPLGSIPGGRAGRPSQATLFPDRDPKVRGVGSNSSDSSREQKPSENRSLHLARPSSENVTVDRQSETSSRREVRLVGPALAGKSARISLERQLAPVDEGEGKAGRPVRIWVAGSALALVLLALGVFWLMRDRFRHVILTKKDAVAMTVIENHTGDKVFDGSVAMAVQIALAQSPYLRLHPDEDYRLALRGLAGKNAASPETARDVARRLGAKAYLYGAISGAGAPYAIHIELRDVATGKVLLSTDGTASSREQVTAAVDLMTYTLRSGIGEDAESIARSQVPLAREATQNLEALHEYAAAESLLNSGHLSLALAGYRKAVALDPKFTQALLRMVTLYRFQHAENEMEATARMALEGSTNAGEQTRLLAQFVYEMNATYDYAHATGIVRQVLTLYPQNVDALNGLALAQRLQGRLPEALEAAQRASAINPWNIDAYFQTELALIALDRYDASLRVQGQLTRMGLTLSNGGLIAAYLAGRQDLLEHDAAGMKISHNLSPRSRDYGLYLDNTGQMAAGTALWTEAAEQAQKDGSLTSAASAFFAQGALDRALAGDCAEALTMAEKAGKGPQGEGALFNGGMADALCGNSAAAQKAIQTLQQHYPQSTAVNGYFIADLKGALALHDGDPEKAIEILKPARAFDLVSLTPFLRGRAHVALRQIEVGIVDYQMVLSHRGITFTVGSNVYPMAQIGVARAFGASGDVTNSVAAYRNFAELWKAGDKKQTLMVEAQKATAKRVRGGRGDN